MPDPQCGFKGFRREVGQDLFARLRTTGIVFDAEVIFLARRLGYSMKVVPVMWHDVRGSRMRVRPTLALRVLWDLLRIPLLHRHVRAAGDAAADLGAGLPAVPGSRMRDRD